MRRSPLEYDRLEDKVMTDGLELMRLLAQAHMSLRALREQRRADVTDADGDVRAVTEDGQEHTRVMIFGPVAPRGSPIARRGRRTYTRRTRSRTGRACTHTRPGWKSGRPGPPRSCRSSRLPAQVSAQGAIQLGKRQAEELTIGAAVGFRCVLRLPAAGAVGREGGGERREGGGERGGGRGGGGGGEGA